MNLVFSIYYLILLVGRERETIFDSPGAAVRQIILFVYIFLADRGVFAAKSGTCEQQQQDNLQTDYCFVRILKKTEKKEKNSENLKIATNKNSEYS